MKRLMFFLTVALISSFAYSATNSGDVVIDPRHPKKAKVIKKHRHHCKHPHCKIVRAHRH